MGTFLQIIYQKCALLQLFLEGVCFLLQSASQTGASTVHVTRGTASSALKRAPLVAPRGQALLVASLLQALRLAQGSPAPQPLLLTHPPSLFPHPPNFILFIKNLNFVSSLLLVLFVIFLYSHTPTPKFQ